MTQLTGLNSRIKLNFDAAVDSRRHKGAVVVIARDHLGKPCGWACKVIPAMSNALTLESLACREAILLARARGWDHIIIEGDCQVVIRALQGENSPIEIQNIIHDISTLSSSLSDVSFSFVQRQGNRAVHSLASKVLQDASFTCNPFFQILFVSSLMPS
ncbi:hypothetical protein P3X46_026412 [Hevea brasiliensis]|uniref:RNase H type-1 domain-containing protein n=1 Tax=Hevea brasiliensis TaxID=3981 RepID=A0ABQ9KZZ3_HEVBR|nr:hypothetical protein P3X46_026412 [Hevea brasiliensis]